jgi:magnesium-protoporphyrin O-methyltransferase
MTCCSHCTATAAHFDRRIAEQDRSRYRRRGPDPTTRFLLEELRSLPLSGRTLLDIGGGIGVIGLELASAGLRDVLLIEAAPHYLAVAREEFERRSGPTTFRTLPGNFVDHDPPPSADVVTLDRVVCCYPDFPALLDRAAASSRSVLALSFPRDRWYVRVVVALANLLRQVTGHPFQVFVHPPADMAAVLQAAGLRRVSHRTTLAWAVECWDRPAR